MKVIHLINQRGIIEANQYLSEELYIKIKEYDNFYVYNYDQVFSPKTNEYVKECRSLQLDKGGKIISRAFPRFFNYGECDETENFIFDDNTEFFEKCDGCCHESTILLTQDGEKTIKEICETKYHGKVLAYDLESSLDTYTEIVAHQIKDNLNNWMEIELEDGNTIQVTENHMFWLPELNCYRRADELFVDDIVLFNNN